MPTCAARLGRRGIEVEPQPSRYVLPEQATVNRAGLHLKHVENAQRLAVDDVPLRMGTQDAWGLQSHGMFHGAHPRTVSDNKGG